MATRQLHAGQVRADAAVDAEAEGGVAVLGPVDDDLVGVLEQRGVAVGGRERQQHPVARRFIGHRRTRCPRAPSAPW